MTRTRELGPAVHANPPAQRSLTYVIGTRSTFLASMVANTRVGAPAKTPLGRLDTTSIEGLEHGLFDAFASTLDVVAFYQERLVNEGYLRTAIEPQSVSALLSTLGVEVEPALAAQTSVVFGLVKSTVPVEIPAATAMRTIPAPGSTAVSFETTASLIARYDWNSLSAYVPSILPPPLVDLSSGSVVLAGRGLRLSAGSMLALTGRVRGAPAWYALSVVSATEDASAGTTAVTFTVLGGSASEKAVVARPALSVPRTTSSLFGANARVWTSVPRQTQLQVASPVGGTWIGSGSAFTPVQQTLPAGAPVVAFAVIGPTTVIAATQGGGLFRSTDGGRTWAMQTSGARRGMQSMTFDPSFGLLAGGTNGTMLRSTDGGDSWDAISGGSVLLQKVAGLLHTQYQAVNTRLPPATIRAVAIAWPGTSPQLFAGTDSGVFCSGDNGSTWLAANTGLPTVPPPPSDSALPVLASVTVWSLMVVGTGAAAKLYAGTSAGLWSTSLPTVSFAQETTVASVDVLSLGLVAGVVVAGTRSGLIRTDTGATVDGTSGVVVSAIAVGPQIGLASSSGLLLAASLDGPFALASIPNPAPMAAVAAIGSNLLAAGPVIGVDPADEWPDFTMSDGQIGLSKVVPGVAAGSVALLVDEGATPPRAGLFGVASVTIEQRQQYGLKSRSTTLTTASTPGMSAPGDLADFGLRTTTAYVVPSPLTLQRTTVAPEATISGTTITLDAQIPELPPGRAILVTGPTVQMCAGGPRIVRVGLSGEDDDRVTLWARSAGGSVRRLGTFDAPSLTPGPTAVELANVLSCAVVGGRSVLTLAAELTNAYVASSVAIQANVAPAVHGQTHSTVIGSGDATRASQTFALPAQPLAVIAQNGTFAPSIEVSVANTPWRLVDTLATAASDAQVFAIAWDSAGNASVVFGDGTRGARLPTGTDNVHARWRAGGGTAGNVTAGTIKLLVKRPLGVTTVDNPLPATGGYAARDIAATRSTVPEFTVPLGRIVATGDLAYVSTELPEVAKSGVFTVALPGGSATVLVLADLSKQPIDPASPLASALVGSIRADTPADEARVGGLRLATFVVIGFSVSIAIDVRGAADKVTRAVREAIRAAFCFDRRGFGQSVYASEITHVVQAVPGVVATRIEQLGTQAQGTPVDVLVARPPRWDRENRTLQPADLLVVGSSDHAIVVHATVLP